MDDHISRQAAIDEVARWTGYLDEDMITRIQIGLKRLPSAQPEQHEDALSRHRLLNDLEELITAWKKYPVMAEQIKGVETAIGYVKTIPSVTPKEQRWIPCSERLPKPYEYCLWTTTDGRVIYHHCDGLFSNYTAWMPLPEPYREEGDRKWKG